VPDRGTLIHGDYHANNILVADDELIMIDMGDVSMGHPIFDFLATAATQANLVELNPAYAEVHTGMPVELIKRLWNYLLDHYFADRDAQEIARIDQQVRLFSKLKVACAPVLARNAPAEIIESSVADAKQNFLPLAQGLIGSVDW
jgi:5-methylthioribose kinase